MDSKFANANASNLASIALDGYVDRIWESFALALLYYDFILTIPLEVERFWRRPLSYGSLFFFVNRYLALLSHIPIIYEFFFVMPESRCRELQLYHNIIICLTQGSVGILVMLRIYALYLCDRRILYLFTTILTIGGGVTLWEVVTICAAGTPAEGLHSDISIPTGCNLDVTETQGIYTAITWIIPFVFDAVGFALTLAQVVRMGAVRRRSMFYLMLRDGTVWFGILAVFYLANILTLAFAQPEYKGILVTLTNVISVILITRMMLNIRDPNLYSLPHYYGTGDTLHAPRFHDLPVDQ